MTQQKNISDLLSSLKDYTSEYLREEAGVSDIECEVSLNELKSLKLHDTTAIISVSEEINMLLAFSYDKPLLQRITNAFINDDPDEDADDEDCLDMASEFINIIVGHCTTTLNQELSKPIIFSPPLVINEPKMIRQREKSHLYSLVIRTEHGCLDINCVGPAELFDNELNYLKSK